jgi:hypothetical protein
MFHPDIRKQSISQKGTGIIATAKIPAKTIIIKEQPAFKIDDNEKIVSDMLQLVHKIMKTENKDKKRRFKTLVPLTLDNYKIDSTAIFMELEKLKTSHIATYQYLKNINKEKLLLYCAKYMCNAFEFNDLPVILFNGTLLNHSCLPNVIFGRCGDYMIFETIRDIKKGEELCDSYIDITESRGKRKKHLKLQYGFDCQCIRCTSKKDGFSGEALQIEKDRLIAYGQTKSHILADTLSGIS